MPTVPLTHPDGAAHRKLLAQEVNAVVATQLSGLSDVNTSTPTNRNVLVADGVDWESRALVEADISDLTHVTGNATHTGDVTGSTALTIGAKKVTLAMMEDGTDGELITYDASGVAAKVAVGTAAQVLTSNGAGAAPTFQAAGTGSGWTKIGDTTPTAAQTFDITWDESLYVAVRFEYEEIKTDTDNSTFYCRLGHTNGTVIFDQTGDYEGHIHAFSATLQNMSGTSIVTLHTAWGNATNEDIHGTLELTAFRNANSGAIIHNRCINKDTSGTLQGLVTDAHLEGTNVGAIDTIRFEVQGGATFLASGTVRAYGLLL